jgi:hypothetical protein
MASNSYYSNVPVNPTHADFTDLSRASTPLKPMLLSPSNPRYDDDPLQEVRRADEVCSPVRAQKQEEEIQTNK